MRTSCWPILLSLALAVAPIGCSRRAPLNRTAHRTTGETTLRAQLTKIDGILEEQRRLQHIPGLAFAIVKDDEIIYLKAFGQRDLERRVSVTPDTLFPIGSCTKAFTSMAVAVGQDKGLLSLDDHPREYLPYFKMADPEADAAVTLRDMLSHRTGLRAYADLAAEPGVLTREEYVKAATSAKPTAKFRTTFQYSNAAYSAIGEIVGKVNHSTWERVIDTGIFAPLHMTASLTSARQIASAADHATGYVYIDETKTWRPVPPPESLDALAPGGNIASTVRDMTQWLRMLAGSGRIGGERFVSPAVFRDLTTPQVRINAFMSYALGWATYDWNGLAVVEHNGGSDGISALVSFIPSRRVGFVFLANMSPNFMTQIGNAGRLLWPLILDEGALSTVPANPGRGPSGLTPKSGDSAASSDTSAPTLAVESPSLDALLARMIDAAGGESNLRRHKALEIRALKSYENHGVTGDLTIWAKDPAMRAEEETWTAAGRQIGWVRIYFDGARGGQETTFGQDSINDDSANQGARRDNDFRPLLNLKRLYSDVRLLSSVIVTGEGAHILELTPAEGRPVRLYVSVRTALVVQRETEGQSTTFEDYRAVDGEQVPFLTTIRDALGETTVRVGEARFNTDIPDAVFAPQKGHAR
jgi:CubicO group peptidase (beta-lactamase class C family)